MTTLASMLNSDLLRFLDAPALAVGLFPGRLAAPGGVYVSIDALRRAAPANAPAMEARSNAAAQLGLSPRQAEVLELLLKGLPNKLIARRLDISSRTVESHKYQIMDSLGVQSTAELIRVAIRHGVVDP